ncbi:MAG: hypothetical protein AMXMBFR59_07020 [Rhodanobacteraceae bacterium]
MHHIAARSPEIFMNAPITKLRYSIKEACNLLGISERTLRTRVATGEIDSHLDGDRRFISAGALQRYIERAELASAKSGEIAA